MTDFVSLPIEKLLNRRNPITRIENLEARTGAAPSDRILQLSQIAAFTGNLIVDGGIAVVDTADGTYPVVVDAGGVTFSDDGQYFSFKDTTGQATKYILRSADDALSLNNTQAGKAIRLWIKQTDNSLRFVEFKEDPANANVSQLNLDPSTTGAKFSIGGSVVLWARKDGTETVFNDDSYDIDHRFEGATDTKLVVMNGGLDAVGMGGDAESGYKLKVTGDTKITGSIRQDATANQSVQTTTGIGASATTIFTFLTGFLSAFLVVAGNDGTNFFMDLVVAADGANIAVISTNTLAGTPSARTYAAPGSGAIKLSMASGTYKTHVEVFSFPA